MFLLNIRRLVKGAKQAGLDPDYIEKLSNHPTYKPNDAVLKVQRGQIRNFGVSKHTTSDVFWYF